MIKERKIGKTAAVLASIAALGLGGAAIAGATGVVSGDQSEQANEAQDNEAQEKGSDAGEKGEFQTPSNTSYEVQIDKGGKEIDVYLDQGFQVITTNAGS